jgi:DNA-binding MarR family transcriptional regulator
MSFLARLFRRTSPTPVELDLHQQLALLTMARFGPCSFNRLFEEVSVIRATTQAEMVNAVLKMETAGVIERQNEPNTAQAQRRYRLTRRARRILSYIPREPRSAMEFYI